MVNALLQKAFCSGAAGTQALGHVRHSGQRQALAFIVRADGQQASSSGVDNQQSRKAATPNLNIIPKSRWDNGIPPVMGAHLMASGAVAPISTSKGAGTGEPFIFSYPGEEIDINIEQYASPQEATQGLVRTVVEASAAAIKAKGSFTIALTGGSLLNMLGALVDVEGVDFSRWYVFFGDERNVPLSHPDSNYKGAYDNFLSQVPIPARQIFALQEGLSVTDAATNYAGRMLSVPPTILPRTPEGFPILDLALLGVGPDGHVCSLFPNRSQTAVTEGWVVPISDSPKPPPERITLTLPVLNSAKQAVFVALGAGKAEAVQRVLEVQSLPGALPAQMVRPTTGTLTWILDNASAKDLNPDKWGNGKAFPRSNV